jgi:hypothetical protein
MKLKTETKHIEYNEKHSYLDLSEKEIENIKKLLYLDIQDKGMPNLVLRSIRFEMEYEDPKHGHTVSRSVSFSPKEPIKLK